MDPILRIHNLAIAREDQFHLNIPELEVDRGQILAIIGPNGAGKSTLLMAIAGLLEVTKGEVIFSGQIVQPSRNLGYRRKIAMVMQSPLLLHASVFDNVATGLRFRRMPESLVHQLVDEWMIKLGIISLKKRSAQKLSGGEAQRASLARAMVLKPDLLLLDEPFGALDAPTRATLLEDLKKLLVATDTTTILVTHDFDEALFFGDRLSVLIGGRLRQTGSPQEVFCAPVDPDVASFVGVETIIPGTVLGQRDGLNTIDANGVRIQAVGDFPVGKQVYSCLRPEDITLFQLNEQTRSSARNVLSVQIVRMIPQGALFRVILNGSISLAALVTRSSAQEMNLQVGQTVAATFKASAVHIIPKA
jgi:molybdopterin-binding protein